MGTNYYQSKIGKCYVLLFIVFTFFAFNSYAQNNSYTVNTDTTDNSKSLLKVLSGLTADKSNGTHLILYRQSKKENEEPIKFKINGKKQEFLPYSEMTVQTDSLNNEVQICYDRKYMRCKKYTIQSGKKKYLKFSRKKDKAPTLKEVNEIDGENHSMRAAAQQQKREEEAKEEVED